MKTVLIVDDEQEMTLFLSKLIERKGLKALTASTGEDALRLYKENKPDCVFLDLHLPGTKGTEVLKKLRESDPKLKAYFITGDQLFAEKNPPESIGASGYLLKPIDTDDIIKIISLL